MQHILSSCAHNKPLSFSWILLEGELGSTWVTWVTCVGSVKSRLSTIYQAAAHAAYAAPFWTGFDGAVF